MKVEGACHCGNIRYEAELDPNTVGICHCTDCQTLTGSAYRVGARAKAESFVLTGGTPTIYIKTADSGTRRAHAFCPVCGSPVYAAAPENPLTYSLRVGALKQRAVLPPVRQLWCGSGLPWAMDITGIPRIEPK
jgi:hypothetical protein